MTVSTSASADTTPSPPWSTTSLDAWPADPQLSRFFVGHSTQSLQRIRQLVVEQLCQAAGGPCFYTGRSMKESHAGMGISQAEWEVAVKHLTATLDKFKVGPKEREELFAAIGPLQADIVDSKK